jgi:hypothetical protein
MKTLQQKLPTPGLIQALILVVLLNLSGHLFLHLGDALLEAEETHLSAPHEAKTVTPPQHFCSVCQDHQHLALDTPSLASSTPEAVALTPTRFDDLVPSSRAFSFKPTRAPPRR